MKKFMMLLMVGVVAFSAVGCSGAVESSGTSREESTLKYIQENSYSLGFAEDGKTPTLSVDGVIENTSNNSYSDIKIVFDIFDDAGVVVGNSVGTVAHLGRNSKANFTTYGTYKDKVARFKIATIVGTPN